MPVRPRGVEPRRGWCKGQATETIGMDPIHFAVMAVLNLMIGLTTPLVGVCLFVVAGIGNLQMLSVARAILLFLVCNLIVLLLVSYIPAISL